MNNLSKGIKFLNQEIKIKCEEENKKLFYSSTVHPVFLPLNMTEVYALTVGLKKAFQKKEKPLWDTIFNNIAEWIYSQLTDYGKEIISEFY